MIITKRAIPRRAFLRGTGVLAALPLLDAMVPALTAMRRTPANPANPGRVLEHGEWCLRARLQA